MSDPERNEAAQAEESGGNAPGENFDLDSLRNILEGILLAAARPLNLDQLQTLLGGEEGPDKGALRRALQALEEDCAQRGIELVEVASGFRLQVRQELQPWVTKLWEERPPRYSRALLETLALIAYRQPITRGEIEDVRGVSVSTNIIRQLEEREWIRVVGHRDVPGKPALFGTTKAFLDYFGLKSLDDLPSLAELRDIESLEPELDFSGGSEAKQGDQAEASEPAADEETGEPSEGPEEATADEQETPAEDEAASGGPAHEETQEPSGESPAGEEPDTDAAAAESGARPTQAEDFASDDPVAGTADAPETADDMPTEDDPEAAGPDAGSDPEAETGEREEAPEDETSAGDEPPDGEAASAGRR